MRKLSFLGCFLTSMAFADPVLVLDLALEAGDGEVKILLRDDLAPQHVERIVTLVNEKAYDNVAFHRVIEGFMAQTGDVQFGKIDGDMSYVGAGSSEYPDLKAEFTDQPFVTGIVGMARASSNDSANSQFFIMLEPGHFLNGAYTVIGEVLSGQDVVARIKKGESAMNGRVEGQPDFIRHAYIEEMAN